MGTGISGSFGRYSTGSITEQSYAIAALHPHGDHVNGAACTAGDGVREVDVASGTVWALGAYDAVTGATVTLSENTSGLPRVDTVVVDMDYSGNDTAITVLEGTPGASPAPPNLTRDAGTRWQVPLADVTVASGAGALTASAVQDVRPGPWHDFTPESPWLPRGGAYQVPGYRLDGTTVDLRGDVEYPANTAFPGGATTPSIVTLPYRWRPVNGQQPFTCSGHPYWAHPNSPLDESANRVDVAPSGIVKLMYVRNNADNIQRRWLSLAPIRFDISDNGRL